MRSWILKKSLGETIEMQLRIQYGSHIRQFTQDQHDQKQGLIQSMREKPCFDPVCFVSEHNLTGEVCSHPSQCV